MYTQRFTLILSRSVLPGHVKSQLVINGTSPGPVLRVTLGNWVNVRVINELDDDATVHWHGMTQYGTPFSDGVPGLTQCLIKNISSDNVMDYVFKPDKLGTYFYHGHHDMQLSDGLVGALLIVSPDEQITYANAGAPYTNDVDESILLMTDYYDRSGLSYLPWYLSPASDGDEPVPDNFTVNNFFSGDSFVWEVDRQGGASRIRLINAGTFSMFTVSIDGLPLTVIEVDGVSVEPYTVSSVTLNTAQRVSVVVDWNNLQIYPKLDGSQSIWIHVYVDPTMFPQYDPAEDNLGLYGTDSTLPLNINWKGIISFSKYSTLPTYSDSDVPVLSVPPPSDLNMLAARPLISMPAPPPDYLINIYVVFQENEYGVNTAYINGKTFSMEQLDPNANLLFDIVNGKKVLTFDIKDADTEIPPPVVLSESAVVNKPASPSEVTDYKLVTVMKHQYHLAMEALFDVIKGNRFMTTFERTEGNPGPPVKPAPTGNGKPKPNPDPKPKPGPKTPRPLNIPGDAVNPFIVPYNKVVDVMIENTDGGEHPFHFHGYTFWVIATSSMPNAANTYGPNYLRRDVVSVPAQGWARIRFVSNNPGVWMLHCHIDWHVFVGLAATVIVAPEQLLNGQVFTTDVPATMYSACGVR